MRDILPGKVNKFESGIVNLDSIKGNGTHWICYFKKDETKFYFDSFGNIIDKPFRELVDYLGKENIFYNDCQIQNYEDPPICGHLCVYVLNELGKNIKFERIINNLLLNKYEFTKYF